MRTTTLGFAIATVFNASLAYAQVPPDIAEGLKKIGQIVHGRKVVTASDGTFVLEFRGGLKPTGASTSEVNGRFVLKKGTNAYKGLHGSGRIHATLDSASGSITAVDTGKAHVNGG